MWSYRNIAILQLLVISFLSYNQQHVHYCSLTKLTKLPAAGYFICKTNTLSYKLQEKNLLSLTLVEPRSGGICKDVAAGVNDSVGDM